MARQTFIDPNGRHVRIYATLLNSAAWRVLGYAAKSLFIDMRAQVNGTNNGNISATLADLKHKGWKSPATLATALYELRSMGFLVQTRGGGVEHGSRVCSLYAFTDLQVYDFPKVGISASKATHDYLRFETVCEAKAALQNGVTQLRGKAVDRKKTAADRKKSTLQILYPTDSKTVAVERVHRYKNCSRGLSTASKTAAGKESINQPQSSADKGFAQNFVEVTP